MPMNDRLSTVAFAKQTAKGAAPANPSYSIGMSNGVPFDMNVKEADMSLSGAGRAQEGRDRTDVTPQGNFDTVFMPQSGGLLLFGACGSQSVSGTAAPYTHTYTPGTDLPYFTYYSQFNSTLYQSVKDAKVESFELDFVKTGALTAKVAYVGCNFSIGDSAWTTACTAEGLAGGKFKGLNGVFTIDGAGATIAKGNIKLMNNLDTGPGQASSMMPPDVWPGQFGLTLTLTVIPDDVSLFRKVLTGTTTGTAAGGVYEGTAEVKLVKDASTDLDFTAPRMAFATKFPTSTSKGGMVSVDLQGIVLNPTTGNPFTFVLRNAVPTY